MRTIKASEFKATCLRLMEEVARTGEPVVITKHGKPVSMLSPMPDRATTLFGLHRGMLGIRGDLMAPLDETWDAEQ